MDQGRRRCAHVFDMIRKGQEEVRNEFKKSYDQHEHKRGSPIYRWESDGWPHILGIVRGEDNTTNYGVRLTEDKFDWIMAKAY